MNKYSKNNKLNAVMLDIERQLKTIHDTEEESVNEVKRYMREFTREPDYNIAQYGNVLIYYDDVREMYKRAGYKSMDKMSDSKVWEIYLRQVGYVARRISHAI